MRLAPALAAALAALALAGCDDEEDETTPASLVPANALAYGEATLRPEGEERTAIEAPLTALLDTDDPGSILIEEFDRMVADEGSQITWETDIEPWLGERAAVFFTSIHPTETAAEESFAERGVDGAIVVESTDADAADAFVEKVNAEDELHDASLGVVGDHVVFGSEAGFEDAVDVEGGADSLADDPDFEEVLGDEDDAAAGLYVDVPAIVAAADERGELSDSDREALDTIFAGIADEPIAAVLGAETTGFGLEVSYGSTDVPFLSAAAESALLRDLPEDSWFAAGFSDAGGAIGSFVERAEDFGISADEIAEIEGGLRRKYGLGLRTLYAPLGDGAVFANGQGIFGTGGGLVFETTDSAAAATLIAGLERAARRGGEQIRSLSGAGGETGFSIAVPDVPGTVNFVAGADRIVIAYGEEATAAALDPSTADDSLGESEDFAAAEEALGEDYAVSGYVDFAPLIELFEAAAFASPDPALENALPYLESLDFLIAGSSSDGERDRQKLFLGVADIVADPSA